MMTCQVSIFLLYVTSFFFSKNATDQSCRFICKISEKRNGWVGGKKDAWIEGGKSETYKWAESFHCDSTLKHLLTSVLRAKCRDYRLYDRGDSTKEVKKNRNSKNKATQDASVLLLSFIFLFFGGILVPQLGIEPVSLQWKLRVLTAGLPGNSQNTSGFNGDASLR